MEIRIFWISPIVLSLVTLSGNVHSQKQSGIFYTTIFAKTGPYERLSDFGSGASYYFFQDVTGDGQDDAVCYFDTGRWMVAASDGTRFGSPTVFFNDNGLAAEQTALMGDVNGDGKTDAIHFDPNTGNWVIGLSAGKRFVDPELWSTDSGAGSSRQFLADVNGDGYDDAIIYFHAGLVGKWYVGLSDGYSSFGVFSPWITEFGHTADEHFLGDVDGDGKADAVCFQRNSGSWQVASSDGQHFINRGTWKTDFGRNAEESFVYDVDGDGKVDISYHINGEWWVSYAQDEAFSDVDHQWLSGHRPATMVSRGNKPAPQACMIGRIQLGEAVACVVSADEWLCLGNANKSATIAAPEVDTWEAWGNPYTPAIGRYDAGDLQILDQQLKKIHDAGFTYIMFDITNGANKWVDGRALKVIERIQHWNANLSGNQHKLFFCIAMGSSRGFNDADAAARCEYESKRTWEEFYEPYKEAYYFQDGKPLLIHFVEFPANRTSILKNQAVMPFFRHFTVRWMFNEVKDQPEYRNTYGWPLVYKGANPVGDEVMAVSPGFWNGVGNLPDIAREQGDFYRSLWVRVLQYNPQSVWVNSFNESWEHTAVEPARLDAEIAAAHPDILQVWSDYYGEPMDDFYWVMTKQYNRLFMYGQLFEGAYLQENGSEELFVVQRDSVVSYGHQRPRMAPVLLVPKGFLSRFKGNVINDDLETVGHVIMK